MRLLGLCHVLLQRTWGEPRLLADLEKEDFEPKDGPMCWERLSSECLSELHSGRFEGAQQHRQAEETREAERAREASPLATDSRGRQHYRLLLLITTVWRNFQRRQLLRNALIWCRRLTAPSGGLATWRFLLGDAPARFRHLAVAEAEKHDDMQLLGGPDEIDYRHVGDAYNLREPNPELLKLIVSFRRLRMELTFDYVLVADDDSFVSVSNALDLTHMLPKEKVYVGNMIDTIPQRWHEGRGIVQEYSVNLYLGSPSKLPIFAHGMGFVLSADLAEMLAEHGFSLKLRGNDDMLFGIWLRSIEGLHYLHYFPLFHDHAAFGSLFSRSCDKTSVVVHRMTSERWRTFDRFSCHICGEDDDHHMALEQLKEAAEDLPSSPLDFDGDSNAAFSKTASRGKVRLAILIFGSRWSQPRLRRHLRQALAACTGHAPDVVRWRFVMGLLPFGERRRRALEELMRHRDMTALRSAADGNYAYEEAWPLVEEHFGHADFVLCLDHRSFVNVKVLLQLLQKLPAQRMIQGNLLDESVFDPDDARRKYLWRRRAASFPHGMGFVLSNDVAKFIAEMSQKLPLRQAETAVDVALGFWIQLLEDVSFQHFPENFHELPMRSQDLLSSETSMELRRNLTAHSAVAWPMGPKWWQRLDPVACNLLGPNRSEFAAVGNVVGPDTATAQDVDCWKGMPGRPEAWFLACCSMAWANCWSAEFTPERCCKSPPLQPLPDPPLGLEELQKFLHFDASEVQLFLSALSSASSGSRGSRLPCLAAADCAKEGFARLYQGFWQQKLLPLRHPWFVKQEEDALAAVNWILREGNQGQFPKGQEHILERVQVAHFLSKLQRRFEEPTLQWPQSKPRRCLEWDSGGYSRHFFASFCQVIDVVTYKGDGLAEKRQNENGKIDYFVDIHIAHEVVPENSTSLVVCAQVFEHLHQPFIAMQQIHRLLAPGGFLAFSVPLFSEIHGAPQDYWRYTPSGANQLAVSAGLEVLELYAPGSLRETVGHMLGMTKPYWQEEDMLEDRQDNWPLQVYMLARKPW